MRTDKLTACRQFDWTLESGGGGRRRAGASTRRGWQSANVQRNPYWALAQSAAGPGLAHIVSSAGDTAGSYFVSQVKAPP